MSRAHRVLCEFFVGLAPCFVRLLLGAQGVQSHVFEAALLGGDNLLLLVGVVERTLGGAVECFALFEHGAAVQADDEVQDAH